MLGICRGVKGRDIHKLFWTRSSRQNCILPGIKAIAITSKELLTSAMSTQLCAGTRDGRCRWRKKNFFLKRKKLSGRKLPRACAPFSFTWQPHCQKPKSRSPFTPQSHRHPKHVHEFLDFFSSFFPGWKRYVWGCEVWVEDNKTWWCHCRCFCGGEK